MTDVAVIGFGPVGATLALLLAGQGLTVRVLDREPAAYHLPRAVHFDDEVMRIFQAAGVAAAVLPHTHVSPGTHFRAADGRLLMDWSRPQALGPLGWHAS
jgi:3-(3-hydroxy-phenyl)propionate hydroxylase